MSKKNRNNHRRKPQPSNMQRKVAAPVADPQPNPIYEEQMIDLLSSRENRDAQDGRKPDGIKPTVTAATPSQPIPSVSESDIESRAKELNAREAVLAKREAELNSRELEAEAGFLAQHQVVLDEVQRQVDLIHSQITETTESYLNSRRDALEDMLRTLGIWQASEETHLRQLFDETMSRIQNERQELEAERIDIYEEKRSIARTERRLRAKEANLTEREHLIEDAIEERVNARTDQIRLELQSYKGRYNEVSDQLNSLLGRLEQWDEVSMVVGRGPESILTEFKRLHDLVASLDQELSSKLSDIEIQRLRQFETQNQELDARLSESQRANEELKRQADRRMIGVVQVETFQDQIATLEATRDILQQQLKELRDNVERSLQQGDNRSPFPQCRAIDTDPDFQNSLHTSDVGDLKQFAETVREFIAANQFYYSPQDLRSFVAGMAAGQLIILQGISGTGKTSLPLHFATAVGGSYEMIEVQAGWRDRDDLLGYYNAFEQRFFEKRFLQALYKAQSPAYEDRIFLVILDEMNLSYPEQYFADFLSATEMKASEDRSIELIPRSVPEDLRPIKFRSHGRRILIPSNVWFVGTANQDETTKDIADKTYDRSHVMELPERHPSSGASVAEGKRKPPVISYKSLSKAFEKAAHTKKGKEAVDKAKEMLVELHPFLSRDYRIGWGNRLESQLQRYVPVVVACEGNWSEAIDYILAFKILRKIRDRYEIDLGDLDDIWKQIDTIWQQLAGHRNTEENLPQIWRVIEIERQKKQRYGAGGST